MILSKKVSELYIISIIALAPLLSLFGVGAVFLLILTSLLSFYKNNNNANNLEKVDWIFILIFTLPFLVAVLSMLVNQSWVWRYVDKYIRYPVGALSFYLLMKRKVEIKNLKPLKQGIYLAASVGFFYALVQKIILGYSLASAMIFSISFGEIMTMIAALSLLKFDNDSLNNWFKRIAFFVLAMLASIMAGTKGAWIAYPFLLWIIFNFHFNKNVRKQLFIFFVTMCTLVALLWGIPFSRQRIQYAVDDVKGYYEQGAFRPTSQGLRLMMWNTAIEIYKDNPVFGVGPANVNEELVLRCQHSSNESIRSKLNTYKHYLMHVHNDWLQALAGQGLLGLLALLSFAFTPIFYCFLNWKRCVGRARTWLYFNILINVGFAIFCTTQCLHMVPRDFWITFNIFSLVQLRLSLSVQNEK